jgi:hypothetical protein
MLAGVRASLTEKRYMTILSKVVILEQPHARRWWGPSDQGGNHQKILFKCCCTAPATPVIYEAFIREAFPFPGHLVGFWCFNVSLGAIGTMEESCVGHFFCEYSKGGWSEKKFRKSQIRKFHNNFLLDLKTFCKCSNLQICNLWTILIFRNLWTQFFLRT